MNIFYKIKKISKTAAVVGENSPKMIKKFEKELKRNESDFGGGGGSLYPSYRITRSCDEFIADFLPFWIHDHTQFELTEELYVLCYVKSFV